MKTSKSLAKPFPPRDTWGAESQYLKIERSSVRFMKLMQLAGELGCSWQSIAREAIDMLLETDLRSKISSRASHKLPKN